MASFDDLVKALLESRSRTVEPGYSTMTYGPDPGDPQPGHSDVGAGQYTGGYWDSAGNWVPSNGSAPGGGTPIPGGAPAAGGSAVPPAAGAAAGAGAGAAAGAGSAAGSAAGSTVGNAAANAAGGILGTGLSWADVLGGLVSAFASPGNQSSNQRTNATTTETNTYDPRREQYLNDLESELYGGGRNVPYQPSTPYTPPPGTPGTPPASGGGGGIAGGPRQGGGSPPVVQPNESPGGMSALDAYRYSYNSLMQTHNVAHPSGFWVFERGNPNSYATVGSNHTRVHFGADGYIDGYQNPGSSNGATQGDASWQQFDPFTFAGVSRSEIPSQTTTPQPSTPYTPPPVQPSTPYTPPVGTPGVEPPPISQDQFAASQGYTAPAGSNLGMMSQTASYPTGPVRGDTQTIGFRGTDAPSAGGSVEIPGYNTGAPTLPRMPVIPGPVRPPTQTVQPGPVGYGGTHVPQPGEGIPGTPGPVTPYTGPGYQPPTGPPIGSGGSAPAPNGPYQWGSGGATGNRNAAGGTAYDAYGNLIAHPDMDPQTRNAIQQEALNAARAGYAGYGNQMARRQAATGNSAGYAAGISDLARRASSTYGSITRQNLIDFERERQRRYEAGLSGMMGLYGGETSYASNLQNQRGAALNQPTNRTSTTVGTGNVVHSSGSLFSRLF